MPIHLVCPNGHKLVIKESLAGKKIKCPKCNLILVVPSVNESDFVPSELVQDLGQEGSNNTGQDWLSEDLPVNIPTPAAILPPSVPLRKSPVATTTSSSKISPKVLIVAVSAVGSIAAISLLAVIALFFLNGKTETARTKPADRNHSESSLTPPPASPHSIESKPSETNRSSIESEAQSNPPPAPSNVSPTPSIPLPAPTEPKPETTPAPVATQANLTRLTKIPFDEKATCFKLPSATWASAYDEVTGRIAVTNDAKGILIYSIEDLLQGKMEPSHVLPTTGVPTSVCLKHIGENRVFVYAGKGACSLLMVDADSMQPFDVFQLDSTSFVSQLAGSSNPDDPYVYFTSSDRPDERAGLLGRADLVSRKQEEKSRYSFYDCSVSPDGNLIFARRSELNTTSWGTWSELLSDSSTQPTHQLERRVDFSELGHAPTQVLGDFVSIGTSIYREAYILAQKTLVRTAKTDFVPAAIFKSKPYLVGAGVQDIVIGSSNHFGRLASIPMPADWFSMKNWSDDTGRFADTRYQRGIVGVNPGVKTSFYNAHADDTRNLGIVMFDEYLVVAHLSKLAIKEERFLSPKKALPEKVLAGKQLELKLQAEDPDATFAYIPDAKWLADENVPFKLDGGLTTSYDESYFDESKRNKRKSSSKSELRLRRGINWNSTEIELESNDPLKNRALPITLRVGAETMSVIGSTDRGSLKVERTRQIAHDENARLAIDGENSEGESNEEQTTKIPFLIQASMGPKQTLIYTDLDRMGNVSVPFKIQVGDEKMTVTAIDSFKESLTVQRTREIPHGVSEPVFILKENPKESVQNDLPKIEGNVLRWTPSRLSVGKNNLRIRAKLGDAYCEWIWQVEVLAAPTAQFPFYAQGVNAEPGTNLVVIWGVQKAPDPKVTDEGKASSILCIYDTTKREILRQTEVPYRVDFAVLHRSSIYTHVFVSSAAALGTDLPKKESKEKSQGNESFPSHQLLRLDAQSFKIMERVPMKDRAREMKVIGDKNLVVGNLRYSIPDLKAANTRTQLQYYHYSLHGRLQDGWVMDGIVWNEKMTKPRLLLHPANFERPQDNRAGHDPNGRLGFDSKFAWTRTNGPNVTVLESTNGYQLRNNAKLLEANSFGVFVTSPGMSNPDKPPMIPFGANSGAKAFENRYEGRHSTGTITDDEKDLYVVSDGQLHSMPLTVFAEEKKPFQFLPEQSSLVLETGKRIKVQYSAPGAAKYHLSLRWNWDAYHPDSDVPFFTAESNDGSFELNFDPAIVAAQAPSLMEPSSPRSTTLGIWKEGVIAYLKDISVHYKELTGKTPKTIPIPIYAVVSARHENGIEIAALVHAYLVEPPLKEIQKIMVKMEGK